MTATKHLKFCRIIRLTSAIIGGALIVPLILVSMKRDVSKADLILPGIGLAVFYLPYILFSQGVSARCRQCRGQCSMREAHIQKESLIHKSKKGDLLEFRYRCKECKAVEKIPANIWDRMLNIISVRNQNNHSASWGD